MSISLTIASTDPLATATALLVLGVFEGDPMTEGPLGALARALPGLGEAAKQQEFTGKKDTTFEFPTLGAAKATRIALVGLGKPGSLGDAGVRVLAAKAARHALSVKAVSLSLVVPPGIDDAERAVAEGLILGAYRFTRYLTGDRVPKQALEKATLFVPEQRANKATKDAVATGQAVAEAICIARDLINEPPNELYPEALAQAARDMCASRGLACTVLEKKQLEEKGMKLILAVGQGSVREPRLIHMTYTPATKAKKKLVFVGKGLTFDTGGICIKPAPGMEEMKGDMGGAANVIALMAAVAATKPDVEVHGLIGTAENMPDGNAYRPGDIFGSYDGKTVEIINTDAEGRLVLADVLAYGRELKPDLMLDNATLTGACIVALGMTVSGFYANQDDIAKRFADAAKRAGEAMWQLPLVEDLREGLKSDWADLKHVADRYGGSITAALFLREFVAETPWIHVDIAGPSMANKVYDVYAKGGTGHGVLTYLRLVESYAEGS